MVSLTFTMSSLLMWLSNPVLTQFSLVEVDPKRNATKFRHEATVLHFSATEQSVPVADDTARSAGREVNARST